MKNGLTHAVNIFLALVLALLEVDVGHHLAPPCLLVDLSVFLPQSLLLLSVLLGPFSLLPLLPVLELLELSSALIPALFLLFVLLLLSRGRITLFYRSWAWILSSSSRIRLVI